MHPSSKNPVLLHWSASHKEWAPQCYRNSKDTMVHTKQSLKIWKHLFCSTAGVHTCPHTHTITRPPSSSLTMGWTINHKFSVCSNNFTERRDKLFIIHTSSTLCKWVYGLHTTKPNSAYIKLPATHLICTVSHNLPYQCSTCEQQYKQNYSGKIHPHYLRDTLKTNVYVNYPNSLQQRKENG
jgi:hypothetical protein